MCIRDSIRSGGSMAVVKPSFPLFLEKRGGTLKKVALVHGVNYEGAQFRGGVVRFLADDPELCSYVRAVSYTHLNDETTDTAAYSHHYGW